MRALVHEVGARIFGPAVNSTPPVNPEACWVEAVTCMVGRHPHVPVVIGEQREENVAEIVVPGRKHGRECTPSVMDFVPAIPVAQKRSDTCPYPIPTRGPANPRQ